MRSTTILLAAILCASVLASSSPSAASESLMADLSSLSQPGLFGMFAKLTPGTKEIDGIPFAIGDAFAPTRAGETKHLSFPPTTCKGLHFLHFTESAGDRIGCYTLLYADGEKAEIGLRGGISINDWWKPGPLVFAALAHSDSFMNGDNPQPIGFWRFSVRNPRPDVPVSGIEITNADTAVTINLVAVTLTDSCEDKVGGVPVWVNGMDEEQFLLAVLAQPGDVPGKEKACEELKRVGTLKSVPALAPYLIDEKLSHAARLALASMGYPEAHAALRDALDKTSGSIKAGIIESLGTSRNAEDVAVILPWLRDKDLAVATSAAMALGRLGGTEAISALKGVVPDASGRFRNVVLDALLQCAESLCAKDNATANALYTEIFSQWGLENVRTAAYRGIIHTGLDKTPSLISSALLGNDPLLWNAALAEVRQVGGNEVTKACTDILGQVPREVLTGLIGALAQRGDKSAGPGLVALVEDADPIVSLAAIKALVFLGEGSSVPVLVKVAAHGDDTPREAALQALLQLSSDDTSAALLARIEGADAAETTVLAKVMGQRRDESVVPALRKLAESPDAMVCAAAVQALAEVGGPSDAELLCKVLERTDGDKPKSAAKRALATLGERLGSPDEFVNAILAAFDKGNVDVRCALLTVCGKLRNGQLLQALDKATADGTPEVKDAAIRALAESENPDALPLLLALLDRTSELTQRVLVFRGIARLASDETGVEEKVREDALTRGLAAAERPEEKKLFLGALGSCHTLDALKTVTGYLPSNDVVAEAVMAWGSIAKAILASNPEEVRNAAPGVLARAQEAGIAKESMHSLMDVKRALAATAVPGEQVRFEHVVIDKQFRSEGVAVADVNHDGNNDIIAGDLWYGAPDWKIQEICAPQNYDPNTGYSQCFLNFAADVDDDGWIDSIEFGGPGAAAYWYRNPGESTEHWQKYLLATSAQSETSLYADLLGDGKPVLIFAMNNRATWFNTGQDKLAPWLAHPMTHQMDFSHGLGMGDVNRDGRMDIIARDGWWEGPVDRGRPDWGFHQVPLGPPCANMLVYDVDGDGLNDILSSSAHDYGIWWFRQRQDGDKTVFDQNEIHKGISQTHALILADINNDGLQDFVTGKRYYAHCGHDPGCNEPAVLCWFELKRPEPGKVEYKLHEIDNDSGVGTQFEVCDFDQDGLLDIVTSNKKGVHLFLQRRGN